MGMSGGPTIRSRAGLAAGAALLLLVGAGPSAGATPSRRAAATPTCPPPTLTANPTWSTTSGVPAGQPGVKIASIAPEAPATPLLDMDDDSVVDTTSGPLGGPVVVHRTDGDLTVNGITSSTGPHVTGGVLGDDLDGDGRSELVVWRRSGTSPAVTTRTWVIPGTTPPGTVDVADVGFAVDGLLTGDADGDGLDDLDLRVVFITTTISLGWISPADVLAALSSASPFAQVDRIGLRTDLDFDGEVDLVHLGSSDATIAPAVELSTGPTLPLPLPLSGPTYAAAYTSRSKVIVQTSTQTTGVVVQGFDLHTPCAAAWMRSVVPQLMGRAPTPADYPTFGPTAEPVAAQRLVRTEAMVRSQSARLLQIKAWYELYLGRSPDPAGRAYWLAALRSGRKSPETMAASMLGSMELLVKRTGGDPDSWVTAVFPLITGRAPDPAGRAYWVGQASHLGPTRTAARLLASREARTFMIRSISSSVHVLGGPPPAEVVTTGLQDFAGGGYDAFLARLLASDAVYLQAQRANRLTPTS